VDPWDLASSNRLFLVRIHFLCYTPIIELMKQEELDQINQKIADRSNVFYWQTDRDITPQQAGQIWADRHRYFTDDELEERINHVLGDKVINIDPLDPNAQTNLGNVNSVRVAHLSSGKDIVIRSHPKGIKNA